MPRQDERHRTSGQVSRRMDLLRGACRPRDFNEYVQALEKCEEMLHDEDREWEIFDPCGRSYVRAIRWRQKLLLGDDRWRDLAQERKQVLMGSRRSKEYDFWGLPGRLVRTGWGASCDHQAEIMPVLRRVEQAPDIDFPVCGEDAMRKLVRFRGVAHGTATLLTTLARPDRLLPVNGASEKALAELSGVSVGRIRRPEGYCELLRWLYRQPWYNDPRPEEEDMARIWQYRAALVDAFVWE
ncbi:MAG: hypothetical protein OXN89_04950 [Bryobacterales bacterium]|nr:hypothetical protein [Bryobacterales bacterium]